jgi:hypothetical protein
VSCFLISGGLCRGFVFLICYTLICIVESKGKGAIQLSGPFTVFYPQTTSTSVASHGDDDKGGKCQPQDLYL